MNAYPSQVVAEQILWMRRDLPTTPMHVLKLSYICHGWMLGIYGEPLIQESVEAWRYGPVIPDVYRRYKSFRGEPIDAIPIDRSESLGDLENNLISAVLKAYKDYTGWQLSSITHQPGTPWHKVYNGGDGENAIIPNKVIKEYYEGRARS